MHVFVDETVVKKEETTEEELLEQDPLADVDAGSNVKQEDMMDIKIEYGEI